MVGVHEVMSDMRADLDMICVKSAVCAGKCLQHFEQITGKTVLKPMLKE
jgi:hypothetical protein